MHSRDARPEAARCTQAGACPCLCRLWLVLHAQRLSRSRGHWRGGSDPRLEPLKGVELMKELSPTPRPRNLTRGPGRLTQALGVDLKLDGTNLLAPGPLWLAETPSRPQQVAT